MKKRSELFFSLILVPIDFIMMVAGFVLAYIVRVKIDDKPTIYNIGSLTYLKYLLILLPIWILIFALMGLYNLASTRNRINELVRVFVATASGVMVLVLLDFFSPKPFFPSKSIPIYGFIFSFILIVLARTAIRLIQQYLFKYNIGVHNIAVLGTSESAQELVEKLNHKTNGYNVVNDTTIAMDDWDVASLKELNTQIKLDEIIQVDQDHNETKLVAIIRFAEQNHIVFKYVPTLAGQYLANVRSTTLVSTPIVEMVQTPLDGWGRIVKRLFDFVLAALGIIVLSPIFLAIAILIKLTDPGSVFYRHTRISKGGKKISIIKFRSMYMRYSDGGQYSGKSVEEILTELGKEDLVEEFKRDFKLKNDPRVTPVGKFLRRTSLDEIPQLANVLTGQLSIVGPRPIIEPELAKYGQKAARLLSIKPGLTGLWQVSGRNDISYDERAKLELYYVEHWSLLLDIVIIAKTVLMIIKGSNGY